VVGGKSQGCQVFCNPVDKLHARVLVARSWLRYRPLSTIPAGKVRPLNWMNPVPEGSSWRRVPQPDDIRGTFHLPGNKIKSTQREPVDKIYSSTMPSAGIIQGPHNTSSMKVTGMTEGTVQAQAHLRAHYR